jgi:hypothetical protein
MPITLTNVPINADCTGHRWIIDDEDELAGLVGLVMKCEFGHAEAILQNITSETISYTLAQEANMKAQVTKALTVKVDPSTGKEERGTPKWHRDGLLFEAISWIVARKHSSPDALLRDPHITPTTQGLDGLMIELNTEKNDVTATTVFEDKCTERAEHTFSYVTMPALKFHHIEHRKVLESATTLLRQEFRSGALSSIAAKAIGISVRQYRSSLTIELSEDDQTQRQRVFGKYNELTGVSQSARIACTLITGSDVRDWFEDFAKKVISSL